MSYGNLQNDRSQRAALEALLAGTAPLPAGWAGPGSVPRGVADKAADIANLKDFRASTDSSWAVAFQRAMNAFLDAGGGTLEINHGTYDFDRYALTEVDGRILYADGTLSGTHSQHVQIAPNTRIVGKGKPTIQMHDNTSDAPLGFGGSWQMLASTASVTADYTSYSCSAVLRDSTGHGVTIADPTGIVAGDRVILAGPSGSGSPSAEASPSQFLTVAQVAGTSVYFRECFKQYFEGAATLTLRRSTRAGGWCSRLHMENLILQGVDETRSYFLLSGMENFTGRNLEFDNVNFNFGICQNISIDGLVTRKDGFLYLESASDAVIRNFDMEASELAWSPSLGAIYVNDNAKNILIEHGRVYNAKRVGMAFMWGADVTLRDTEFVNCAASSDTLVTYDRDDAVLRLGHSMTAAVHSTRESATAAKFLTKQTSNSRVVVERVRMIGPAKRLIAGGNVDLTLRDFYGEHSGAVTPIELGETGSKTGDGTHFPAGGVGAFTVRGRCGIKTDQAGSLIIAKASYGRGQYLRKPITTVGSTTGTGDTVVAIADGRLASTMQLGTIKLDHPTLFLSVARTISSVSGNNVTVTAAVAAVIPSGEAVHFDDDEEFTSRWDIGGQIIVNGAVSKIPHAGWKRLYPTNATGAGPYTGTTDLTVPGEGEWDLDIAYLSQDRAHHVRATYRVLYSAENASFPMAAVSSAVAKYQARTAVDISSVSISSSTVTITLSNTTTGKQGRLMYRWRPVASLQTVQGVA